ncbi:MAG: type II secretion system F family protein [Puniceicoccaceae bacterium]|nr:MAG: type II secretion system F family protein [Puniceicoccaceae bacterium]
MPSFLYTAKDARGQEVRGRLEAASRRLAIRQLSGRSLSPVKLVEGAAEVGDVEDKPRSKASFDWKSVVPTSLMATGRPGRAQMLPFLRALCDLISCGIQVGDAVKLLSRRLNNPKLKALARDLWEELSQGRSLSDGMRAYPDVFDEAATNLIEAGEATGNLSEILTRLVQDLEDRRQIKGQILAAMAYPIFIVFMAGGVILIFLFFLLPRIQDLLGALGGDLPLSTRLLVGLSEFALTYGILVVIGLVLAGVGVWSWRRTTPGRKTFDRLVLRVPGVGNFIRDSDILRLSQTLSLLLENGITTIQALGMTERVITNRAIRESFGEARLRIAEGVSISNALKTTGYFPDLVLDILTVGENTGNIVPSLKEMSRHFHARLTAQVRAFMGVISIGVLLVAFGFVGLIALGIISSVFQLSSSL